MAHNIEDMVYENNRAKAQAFADVQDEQIERQRRRDVAEANRAAYDEAQANRRLRRGGSVFSASPNMDGSYSYSNRTFDPAQGVDQMARWGADYDMGMAQKAVADQFADLGRRSKAVQQHNAQLQNSTVNGMMLAAMQNGGRIPQNALGLASRNMGFDGKNQAIYGGGFLGNGNFVYDIATRGQNGGINTQRVELTPDQVYGAMLSAPGIWKDNREAVASTRERARYTHSDKELQPMSVFDNAVQNMQRGQSVRQAQAASAALDKVFASVVQNIMRGGKSKDPRRDAALELYSDKNIRAELGRGDVVRDENGNPVMMMDKNGNEVPQYEHSDELAMKRIGERLDEMGFASVGQGGNDMNSQIEAIGALYDRIYGPRKPITPQEQAIRESQLNRAVDMERQAVGAQRRAEITQRPQQVINYFKDGRWYSGNGYIRDGKVYDGQGYEIEGATPAEMARGADGGVYSNEKGWVARALPSAKELVGGGVGGGSPAQGRAATGAQTQQAAQGGTSAQQGQQQEQSGKAGGFMQWWQDNVLSKLSSGQSGGGAGAAGNNTAVENARAVKAAITEERLRRERERGGLPKGYMPDDKLPDSMIANDDVQVGPTIANAKRAVAAKDLAVNAEDEAKARERSLIEHINSFGGSVERDNSGNQVVKISKYEYLPDDLKKKYPDGVVTGVPLDVADEIQRQAEMGFREHAKAEGKKRAAINKEVEKAANALKRKLLRDIPTDSAAREREYERGLHEIRMEKDEFYRREQEREHKKQRESALTDSFYYG